MRGTLYDAISISRTTAPSRRASRTARYSRIASRIFSRASSSVAPCDQQPGRPGTETLYPSSVLSKAILYLTALSLPYPKCDRDLHRGYLSTRRLVNVDSRGHHSPRPQDVTTAVTPRIHDAAMIKGATMASTRSAARSMLFPCGHSEPEASASGRTHARGER